jgi:bacteriocin-like protein
MKALSKKEMAKITGGVDKKDIVRPGTQGNKNLK